MKRWAAPWGLKVEWVKHYTNARRSEQLGLMIRKQGYAAYGRYWALLEYLGEEFDGKSTSFRILCETFRELLRFRSATDGRLFLEGLPKGLGLFGKQSENVFEIEAPILLDLLGRDFRVTRQHRAETAPQKKIKNKNKIKDKEGEVTALSAPHPLVDLWNSRCLNLPQIKKVSKGREKKIAAILKDHTLDELAQAIDQLAASDFCNGKNDRGWVATFDFLLQPDTPAKALEGKYDNRASQKPEKSAFKNSHLLKLIDEPGEGA